MAIPKAVRDHQLVEARHRCTICSEKCFELHHIVEQAEGGSDEPENLIVLCPNCHQHRYHRSGEFTRDQLRLYKAKLKEQNEVERRLLLNLEEIRAEIGKVPAAESEQRIRQELAEAAQQVDPERAPNISAEVQATSRWLAERESLRAGARRAIEVEWEVRRAQEKAKYPPITVTGVDEAAWQKADDFPAAYRFELILSQAPNHQWVQVFDQEYRISWYNMKRRSEVEGSRLVMIVGDSDNLQGHVDFAKELVKRTNATIERDLFSLIDRSINEGKRRALEEFDAIRSLKARTKDLRI
jgi:hypothetical protein